MPHSLTLMPLMKQKILKIVEGRGTKTDLEELDSWVTVMKINRCGLGHTAANPVVSLLKNFRFLLEEKIVGNKEFISTVNAKEAVLEANTFVKRQPQTV